MKNYTEEQVWKLINEMEWVSTVADHEPCYGQMTIQVALEQDGDYFGEFVQDANGLYTFALYTDMDKSHFRRLVVEYGIVGKNNGKRYPSIVLDGNKWGEDFDYLIDGKLRMQYFHDHGISPIDKESVEYNQLFMLTTMSDEEILAIYI